MAFTFSKEAAPIKNAPRKIAYRGACVESKNIRADLLFLLRIWNDREGQDALVLCHPCL